MLPCSKPFIPIRTYRLAPGPGSRAHLCSEQQEGLLIGTNESTDPTSPTNLRQVTSGKAKQEVCTRSGGGRNTSLSRKKHRLNLMREENIPVQQTNKKQITWASNIFWLHFYKEPNLSFQMEISFHFYY